MPPPLLDASNAHVLVTVHGEAHLHLHKTYALAIKPLKPLKPLKALILSDKREELRLLSLLY